MKTICDDTLRLQGNVQFLTTETEGFGTVLLDFLTSKIGSAGREDEKSYLKKELIAAIHRGEQDATEPQQPPPSITGSRQERLLTEFVARLRYSGIEDREVRIAEAH